jgi:hypothetical protein
MGEIAFRLYRSDNRNDEQVHPLALILIREQDLRH